MEEAPTRPGPDVRGTGRQYWASGKTGKLSLPKCRACGVAHWYPRLYCPHCGSDALEWIPCSGRGVIHTYTVVRQSAHKYFKSKVPYVLAMVDLEEGPRVMTNIVNCDPASVTVGAPVSVVFEKLDDEVSVPLFVLVPEAARA